MSAPSIDPGAPFAGSITAMANVVSESDLWTLSDALLADIPQGSPRTKFDDVRAAAFAAGVAPKSVSTLRQYRDTAHHWPTAIRVPGVSFTAHRAAMRAADGPALLRRLAATYGADMVSAKAHVEPELAAMAGRAAPVTGTTAPAMSNLPGDLATALANAWRSDKAHLITVLTGPQYAGTVAALADLVAGVTGTSVAVQAKSDAWQAPKAKATPKAPAAPKAPITPKGRLRG